MVKSNKPVNAKRKRPQWLPSVSSLLPSLLFCAMAPFLLMQQVNAQAQLKDTSKVFIDPNTVGAQSATLTLSFQQPVSIPAGGIIKVTVPPQAYLQEGNDVPCRLTRALDISQTCATDGSQQISFVMPENGTPLYAQGFYDLTFRGVFFAPLSSTHTDPFKVEMTDPVTGDVLVVDSGKMVLSGLDTADLVSASTSQVNSVIVAKPTAVSFQVTTINPIPASGGVQLRLPKWNPEASFFSRESFVIDEITFDREGSQEALAEQDANNLSENDQAIDYSRLCSPKTGVSNEVQCSHFATGDTDFITLTNMFGDQGREAGDTFQFYVSRLRNSLSMSAVPFEIVTFASVLRVTDEGESILGGKIDSGDAMFEAQQSTVIFSEQCSVNATDPTVQEFSTFRITFQVQVPVQSGCIVTVQLPDDFKLNAGELTRVQGWGIFGKRKDLNFGTNESSRIIKFVDQCEGYTAANFISTLEIDMLQNPAVVLNTTSFMIEVQDKNQQGIAILTTDLIYETSPGKIVDISLQSTQGIQIEQVVDLKFDFTPLHAVSGQSYIKIQMPDQISFSCVLKSNIGLKTAPSCEEVENNLLVFASPFEADNYDGNIPLSLVFRNRVLPGSNLMIKGIKIETYVTIENVDYLIDIFDDSDQDFFAPESQLLLGSEVVTGSNEVYTVTDFSFRHMLANSVPRDAIIRITIPAQIEIGDHEQVTQTCKSNYNLKETLSCELEELNGGVHLLTVRDAIPDEGLSGKQVFELNIGSGLYTPLSMKTSDSFQVNITDAMGHQINYVIRALSVTMKQGKDVGLVAAFVSNQIVGEQSTHSVSFFTPAPLYQGFLIIVNIPEECRTPMGNNFECKLNYPLSQTDSVCRINGQRVTIEVAFDEAFSGERIQIGERISFDFSLIQNPASTTPTEPYEIEIKTGYYQLIAVQRTQGARIQITQPAQITDQKFQALDMRQQANTTVTITWLSTQVYPKDFSVLIFYNQDEIGPELLKGESTFIPCVFKRTVIVQCEYSPDTPGVIKVTDMLIAKQNPGLELSLTLTQQLIRSDSPTVTESWKMITYTDSLAQYSIDTITSDMTFEFTCNLPCLTCSPDDPDFCLSCNQFESDYLILYGNKCNKDCPQETYEESYQCLPCDDKCKTCAKYSGNTCTSCYGGFSDFPFLYGNTCVEECIFGFYGDRTTAKCSTCLDPCETCTDEPDKCLSCKMPPAGEPIREFFHDYDCKESCPDGWVANVPERSNVCEKCSDNCATCINTSDQCFTCKPGMKLNTLDQTCVFECPADITVKQTDPQRGEMCIPCDSSCVTCKDQPTFCTTCQANLSLLAVKGTCKLECDESNFLQVSVDGECKGCSSGCETCQLTQDNCLTCREGTYLYANQCLEQCPFKDGYQYTPDIEGKCTIPGIRCPFGYELIPTGNACALKAQVCIEPNKLNYDKTTCVPGSDSFIPFPMLAFCALTTIVVAIGNCKNKESRFIANLIVFWSIIEFLGMCIVLYLAVRFGIAPVVYMFLVAIMFTIATNLFFFVVFQKQVMNDQTFRHWANYNKCVVQTISILGLVFNFKVYRLLYSKFCGARRFDAPFADPYKFFTPLNIASFLNLFLVMLLCIVGCLFGIYYLAWGYQLLIECVEFLIIEVVMIILYVIEYCQMRDNLLKRKANWPVDAKQVDRMKVNAGFEDDLSDDGQDPDEYMTKSGLQLDKIRKDVKPKALKTIHTMEKVLCQLLVKKHAMAEGYANTREEIVQLHEKELMLRNRRRCMSFRLERPDFREAWGFHSDEEDDAHQNFISEPSSPRSKEMLLNANFGDRMTALNRVYQMRDKFDNCYAEARDPSQWPLSNADQANKKLQTNVMELLGVDDLVEDTQTQVTVSEAAVEDYEYDPTQTAFLINGVIDRMDSGSDENYATNDPLNRMRRGSDPNAELYHDNDAQPIASLHDLGKKKPKGKRKRLTRRRMAELPNFEVEEILGEFELDNDGNQIILKTADGKLNDKYGRLVNRRGYLIDPVGNVITRGNVFIFYKEEVDFDDEIPAPYSFQKGANITKFSIKNFSVHRRMRKKDKLAMQDEFIEREYQRLKMAAHRGQGDIYSEQASKHELVNLNQSEKVNRAGSTTQGKALSSNMQKQIDGSGVALLNEADSQRLGDVDLSNLILQDRARGDYYYEDGDEPFNADTFVAQNTTQVRRKPPTSSSNVQSQHNRRRSSQTGSKSNKTKVSDPVDDDFINEVTEPMKAKTKFELLGTTGNERNSSRQSMGSRSRSRSRSKSNEKSSKSQRKSRQSYKIKNGKMLNTSSHRSLSKQEAAGMSDQHNSAAEIMAMATAGGDEDGHGDEHQLRNLDFDTRGPLNKSSSKNIGSRHMPKRQTSSGFNIKQQRSGGGVYEKEKRMVEERKQAVVTDDAFIKKVQQMNQYLEQKRQSYTKVGEQQARGMRQQQTTLAAGIIDDAFMNPDGSVRHVGLAHKNLNQVYGKVRNRFNKQIRAEGADIKFRPQGRTNKNRIMDVDSRRIIAGMSYNQRERMLQLEINNLIDNNNDDFSLASIQRKLHQTDAQQSQAHSSPTHGGHHSSQHRMRNRNEKLSELKQVYSDYRLDNKNSVHKGILSPRSHANMLTFNANNILSGQEDPNMVGRQVDRELHNIQVQVKEAQALLQEKSSAKSVVDAKVVKTNRTANPALGRTKTPKDLVHGSFL